MNILRILILNDLIEFLDFWFKHKPRSFIKNFFNTIYHLERLIALRANLRNINKPLYGDYTLLGYAIALPYRLASILLGLFLYFILFSFYLIIIILWLSLPLVLLGYGFLF